MRNSLLLLFCIIALSSCSTPRPRQTYPSPSLSKARQHEAIEPIGQSLFNDKTATISEENIQRILNGTFDLPRELRVAIVRLESGQTRNYYWNNENYLKTQQKYVDMFTAELRKSSHVKTVALVPDLLISGSPNFTVIREAAVRMQADVVLIYGIAGDIYTDFKFFSRDDIKAFATTQLVMMDIRTGLIPFSKVVTKDVTSQRLENEMDDYEARQRIQDEAAILTIRELGGNLSEFLNR